MRHRTTVLFTLCPAGGVLLIGAVWLHMRDAETAITSDGVRVVAGRPSDVETRRRADMAAAEMPTQTRVAIAETRADAKHYGEPVIAADTLLDDALAAAPAVIGVRRRLFGMQWPGGRDPVAEQVWEARLAMLPGGTPDRLRVHCSATTCEIATADPALAPRLAALTTTGGGDWAARCPMVAPDGAAAVWSGSGVAVAYLPRNIC